jgi:hypothetical protein
MERVASMPACPAVWLDGLALLATHSCLPLSTSYETNVLECMYLPVLSLSLSLSLSLVL